MNKWISVDERLPHWSDGKVLVFTQYGFSICERTVNGRWKGQHANWITHWMPLPEPPKVTDCLTCRYFVECEPDMIAYHNDPCDLYKEQTRRNENEN